MSTEKSAIAPVQLKKLVERRHPEYLARIEHWDFLASTYQGGRDWFAKNIFKYFKEGSGEYKERINRAYRFNHTREVVNMINKYIFKEDIYRKEDAPDYIKNFWQRATKQGQTMDEFMAVLDMQSSVFGRVWVVVDSTATAEQLVSRADEKQSGTRAYAYWVPPQQVLDLAYDDAGNLMWILIQEVARDDEDPITCTGEEYIRWRLWTQTEWLLIEQDVDSKGKRKKTLKVSGQGEHNLGIVPVIPVDCFSQFSSDFQSPSLIDDIAYLDRAVANYLSNLDAIIQDQTFSQLIIPENSLPNDKRSSEDVLEWGTKRFFTYNPEHQCKPEYISPDSKQVGVILDTVKSIINEIYHSVGVAGERTKQDNAQGIDNSSGVAKAYDFKRVDSLLVTKADRLGNTERKILILVSKWLGKSDLSEHEIGELIEYPSSFDNRGLMEELDIATKLGAMQAPDYLRRLQMEILSKKAVPNMTDKQKIEFQSNLKTFPTKESAVEVIEVEKDDKKDSEIEQKD